MGGGGGGRPPAETMTKKQFPGIFRQVWAATAKSASAKNGFLRHTEIFPFDPQSVDTGKLCTPAMLAAGPPAVRPPPFLRPISDDDDDSQGSFNIDEIDRPIVPLVISIPTVRGPPLDSGGEGRSICRGQIIYFNRARRRSENFTFCYMFIWNSS